MARTVDRQAEPCCGESVTNLGTRERGGQSVSLSGVNAASSEEARFTPPKETSDSRLSPVGSLGLCRSGNVRSGSSVAGLDRMSVVGRDGMHEAALRTVRRDKAVGRSVRLHGGKCTKEPIKTGT